jgi:hypothetical protein
MYKGIDPDYYGFRDEEDGVLEKVEAGAEKLMRAEVGCCCRHAVGVISAGIMNSLCCGGQLVMMMVARFHAVPVANAPCWRLDACMPAWQCGALHAGGYAVHSRCPAIGLG